MTIAELELLIQNNGKSIYSFCEQLTQSKFEADELYQEVFLQAVKKIDKIDLEHNPKSYLLSIAVMLWKNKKRKRAWRMRIAPQESLSEEHTEKVFSNDNIESYVIKKNEADALKEELKHLPDKYQLPLLLYYMEEQSIGEISKVLKIPTGTVKSRLHKAKSLLKERLIDRGYVEN